MKRLLQFLALAICLGSSGVAYSASTHDIAAGKRLYTQCSGCHAVDYNRTGPKHCGVMGRKAGSLADFDFTPAMKDSGIVWTEETLDTFLKAPLKMMPGTSMGFAGISSGKERKQLVAFMNTLTEDSALCK